LAWLIWPFTRISYIYPYTTKNTITHSNDDAWWRCRLNYSRLLEDACIWSPPSIYPPKRWFLCIQDSSRMRTQYYTAHWCNKKSYKTSCHWAEQVNRPQQMNQVNVIISCSCIQNPKYPHVQDNKQMKPHTIHLLCSSCEANRPACRRTAKRKWGSPDDTRRWCNTKVITSPVLQAEHRRARAAKIR